MFAPLSRVWVLGLGFRVIGLGRKVWPQQACLYHLSRSLSLSLSRARALSLTLSRALSLSLSWHLMCPRLQRQHIRSAAPIYKRTHASIRKHILYRVHILFNAIICTARHRNKLDAGGIAPTIGQCLLTEILDIQCPSTSTV